MMDSGFLKDQQKQIKREEFISQIIAFTTSSDNIIDVLREISTTVGKFFKADRCHIVKYAEEGKDFILFTGMYNRPSVQPVDINSVPTQINYLNRDINENVRLIRRFDSPDELDQENYKNLYEREGIKALLLFEFYYKGKPYGRCAIHQLSARSWHPEDISLIKIVLNIIASGFYQTDLLNKEKAAHQASDSIKQKLNLLMNSVPAFISYITRDLKFKYLNNRYERQFNKPYEELIQMDIEEIIGPELMHKSRPMMQKALAGEEVSFENAMEVDGEARYFLVRYLPNAGYDGTVHGFFVLAVDITDRKEIENRVIESEERLRLALDSTDLGAFDHDLKTNRVMFSDTSLEMLSLPPKSEYSYDDFLKIVHPDDRSRVAEVIEKCVRSHGESVYKIEYRTTKADKWIKSSWSLLFSKKGLPERRLGLLSDISKQKKVETDLKIEKDNLLSLFENAPSMICIFEGDDIHFSYANKAYLKQFDFGDEIIGRPLLDVFPESEEQGYFDLLRKVYKTGNPFFGKEEKGENYSNGKRIDAFYNVVYHPKRDQNGTIDGIIVYANDITEQVNARKKVEEFMGIASHELKTPLTTLSAYSELLLNECMENETMEMYANRMILSLDKLKKLVDELLDITRIQSGRISYKLETTDFDTFISKIIEEQKLIFPYKNITFEGKTEESVKIDPGRIEQVIINLISNAIKYSPKEEEINTLIFKNDDKVHFAVKDFGVGITKADQEKIFDRFHRLDNRMEISGLGIGLYLSREIVERHDGSIAVDSVIGSGSTFSFSLPILNK